MATQRHSRVEHWDDERSIGNSLIVTLEKPWCFDCDGEHVKGFDTVRDAMAEVRRARPCQCEACRKS